MPEELDKLVSAFQGDPENESLFNNLKQQFFLSRDWDGLVNLHVTRARFTNDKQLAATNYFEASRIYQKRLNDSAGQLKMLEQAFAASPHFEPTSRELGLVYSEMGRFEDALPPLEAALGAASDDVEARKLKLRLADGLAALGRFSEAEKALGELLDEDPADPELFNRLEKIFLQEKRWKDLGGLLERKLQWRPEVLDRETTFRLATIYRDHLQRPLDAAANFEKLVADRPNSMILAELEKIYKALEHFEDLARTLERLAEIADTVDARSIRFRLGRLYRENLKKPEEGARWIEMALGMGLSDPRALKELEEAYREAEHWEELLHVLRQKVERSEEAGDRAGILLEIGRLTRDRLHDPSNALASFEEAFQEPSRPGGILDEIEKTFRMMDQPAEFAEWVEARARPLDPSREKMDLFKRAAQAHLDVSEPGRAADLLLEVRQAGLEEEGFEDRLRQVLQEAGRTDELAALLDDRARELADPEDRISFLLDKARLLADTSGREEEGIGAFREILEIRPDHLQALGELASLLERKERYEDLLNLYTNSVELASDRKEVANLHVQAGRLLLHLLHDPDRALERFRSAILVQDDHLDAVRGLSDAAKAAGDPATLFEALARLADLEPDVKDRLEARLQQADLQGGEGLHEEEAAALEQAVGLDPGHIPALERLETLYGSLGRHRERASAMERLSTAYPDRESAARVQEKLGALYRDDLSETELAAETFERALAFAPGKEDVLLALERLYETLGREMERVRLLEELASRKEGKEAVPLLIRGAGIAETEGATEKALALLAGARKIDPSSERAHDEAVRLLRDQDLPDMLVQVLASAFSNFPEGRKADLAREIARVKRDRLGDEEGAVDWYKEVRALEPEDTETLGSLAKLLGTTGRPVEAVEILLVLAGRVSEGEEQARFRLRAAEILERDLENPRDALENFARASRSTPPPEGALEGMRRTAEHLKEWDVLAEALEISVTLDPGRAGEPFAELCRIHETKRLDLEGALDAALRWREAAPRDVAPLRALISLYRRLGRYEETASTLVDLAGAEVDPEARSGVFQELAELRAIRFSDPEGSEEALKKAVEIWPGKTGPLEALERFYAFRERHEDRLRCLESLLALDPEGPGAVERSYAIGRVHEDHLSDNEKTRASFLRALNLDATYLPAIRGLQRLAEKDADFSELATQLQREADLPGIDEATRRNALLRLAALRRDSLDDETGAIETFGRVLEMDAKDRAALHGLEELFGRRDATEDLAGVLERLAEVLAHERDRRNAWFRLGLLRLRALDDPNGAVEAFERSLTLDPHFLPAVRKLQETHRVLSNPFERLKALDREIEMELPLPRRLELLREAGRGWAELGEKERAVDRWNKVFEADPGDLEALEALEPLLEKLGRHEDLGRILEALWSASIPRVERLQAGAKRAALLADVLSRHEEARSLLRSVLEEEARRPELLERYRHLCERTHDFEGLAWCIDREIEGAEDPGRRLQLLLEAGAIRRESLEDREGAIARFREAWAAYPESLSGEGSLEGEKAFTALLELYSETGRFGDLVRLLHRRAAFQEGETRGRTLAEAAVICEESLKEDVLAARYYHLALEYAPAHREAIRGLARLRAAQGRHGEVVALRLKEAELEEDVKARVELLLEVASIQEQDLQDFDQAIATFTRAIQEVPGHPLAFGGLARLLPRRERFRDLAELVVRQADSTSPPEAVSFHALAGEIYLENLDDPESAIPHLRRAFEADPTNEEVARRLERALRRTGETEELAKIMEKELAVVAQEDTLRRLAVMKEIGTLYSAGAGNLRRAVGFFVAALKIAPTDVETVRRLEDLYDRTGDLTNLARMLEHEARVLKDPGPRRRVRERLGKLYMRRLGAFEDAIQVYRAMLEEEPGEKGVLESLKRAYRASGRVEDLVKTYDLELAQVEDHARRAEILVTLGRIRQRLGMIEEAAGDVRRALEMVPRNEEAIDVLFHIYTAMDSAEGMAEMLDQKAGLTPFPEEKGLLRVRAGELWERAGRPERAVEDYWAAREVQPRDPGAIDGLARLYESLERWDELVEILGVKADATRSEEEAVALYCKIGRTRLDRLEDLHRAEDAFQMAIEMDPTHLQTLEGLERVARGREDWASTVGYLERQNAVLQDIQRCAYLHIEAAKILMERLGDSEEALRRFKEALKGDPEAVEALWGIASISFEKEEWEAALSPLLRLSELVEPEKEDVARVTLLHFRCGFIKQKTGHPPEESVLHFERALEADPDHLPSLREAEAIYFKAGRWARSKPLVERLLDRHASTLREGEANRLKVNLGIILWKIKEPERGAKLLESCSDPDEEPRALEALEALYLETGNDDSAVSVLERICGSAEDEGEVARANTKIGRILLDRKGDGAAAASFFEKALESRPEDERAQRGLAEALEQAKKWEDAADAWRILAESLNETDDRLRAWVRVGSLARENLRDAEAARDAYQRALALDPAHSEALQGMEGAKKTLKDWPGLVEDFRASLEARKDASPPERAPLWFKLGEALVETGDLASASEALEQAVETAPKLTAAHLLLARIYEKREATLPKAASHYRTVLGRSPRRVDAFRRLAQVYVRMGKRGHAFVPAAVLVAYRTHNSAEYNIYREGNKTLALLPGRMVDEDVRDGVLVPEAHAEVAALLVEVDEFLGDATGSDLVRHGIRRRRRPEGIEDVLEQADTIAKAMSIEAFDVLLAENPVEEGVALENLKTPALVVGPDFKDAAPPERAFLLGRGFGLLLEKLATGLIPPAELNRVLLALASLYIPEAEEEGGLEKADRAFRKRVRGAVPRRVRKRIEPLVHAWWDRREACDLEAFHGAVVASADRWGLICAGDPCAAIRAKLRFDAGLERPEEMETGEIQKWVLKAPDIRDLIDFALSEGYQKVVDAVREPPGGREKLGS